MKSTRKRVARAGAAISCLAAIALAAGCGEARPRTAPVEGTITYKGQNLPHGTIMFQPDDGPAATAEIHNGRYVLTTYRDGDGAVLGKHRVTVISLADQSARLPEERSPFPPALVPLHYNFPDRSGLTAEVEDRSNIIDFPLK